MPPHFVPLDTLAHGEWAEVIEVNGDARWVGRMAELGLRPHAFIRMIQPGQPCLFEIGDCRLSLRLHDELQIWVRPVADVTVPVAEVA